MPGPDCLNNFARICMGIVVGANPRNRDWNSGDDHNLIPHFPRLPAPHAVGNVAGNFFGALGCHRVSVLSLMGRDSTVRLIYDPKPLLAALPSRMGAYLAARYYIHGFPANFRGPMADTGRAPGCIRHHHFTLVTDSRITRCRGVRSVILTLRRSNQERSLWMIFILPPPHT